MPFSDSIVKLIGVPITSYLIAYISIPVLIKKIKLWNILDIPGKRKLHRHSTPAFGGLSFLLGTVLSLLIWNVPINFTHNWPVLSALSLMLITGLRDDFLPLKATTKLIFQILSCLIIYVFSDFNLENLHGIFGIYQLPPYLSFVFTVTFILLVTNGFNLIDGIDGLAASVIILCLVFFSVLTFLFDYHILLIVMVSFIGGLMAFLRFNWEPAKLFMGDTGSLFSGFVISILALISLSQNYNLLASDKFNAPFTLLLSVIFIPVFDIIRVFSKRLIKRTSPFKADKGHIHHHIIRLGFNHHQTVYIILTVNFLVLIVGLLLQFTNEVIGLFSILLLGIFAAITLEILAKNNYKNKFILKRGTSR
jgi:UDP-GlcNAc:undecaprenyl-phosphate/decaprenyl-phosphate GlcNAc-1-phosphate transferase